MLQLLSLVCLDAPLVATAWQALFAHAFSASITPIERAVLFLTTWGIYLFDRLADGDSVDSGMPISARQRFARTHRAVGIVLLVCIALFDVVLVARLSRALLVGGAGVALLCATYLAVNRNADRTWQRLPIKELCIGVLFACGTVAAIAPGAAWRPGFFMSAVLFSLLCATNCAAIAAWERELDVRQGKSSLGTTWPTLGRRLPLVVVALASIAWRGPFGHVPLAIGVPLSVATLLLGLLHVAGRSLPPDDRTALADLALLVPLLPELLFCR